MAWNSEMLIAVYNRFIVLFIVIFRPLSFLITNVSGRSLKNWLSTNRPSFAAANQVVTLTRVTNERVV